MASSCGRPAVTVAVWLAVAIAMLGCSIVALRFETSTLALLPSRAPYVAAYREYSRTFGELDDVIIVLESGDPSRSVMFADRLVETLRRGPVRFNRLAYRVDPASFSGRRLLYLPVEDLRRLRDAVLDDEELIGALVRQPGLEGLLVAMRQRLDRGILLDMFDAGLGDGATAPDLGAVHELVAQLKMAVDGREPRFSLGSRLFPRGADASDGVFLSDDKRLLFIFADPVAVDGGFAADRRAVEEIRRQLAALRREFPDVQAGVTGGPALSSDEMTTALEDSRLATLLAAVLTLGVLLVAFRQVVKPLLMLLVLGVSVVVSLGIVALTVGHLTIFSVMFISMVVGLGIDYGIYVLFRYEDARAERSPQQAVVFTAERSGLGIALGALSAIVTFYVLILTEFDGIREFGFVAGTALFVAFLSMLTLFPAVLVLVDGRRGETSRRSIRRPDTAFRVLALAAARPTLLLTLTVVISAVAAWQVSRVGFDYNVMNLQARGTESVRWEEKIVEGAARSAFAALDTARSLPELRDKEQAFRRLPSVSRVESVLTLLPDRQPEKLAILAAIAPSVAAIDVAPRRPFTLAGVSREIATLAGRLAFVAALAPRTAVGDDLRAMSHELDAVRIAMARVSAAELARRLERLDRQIDGEIREAFLALRGEVVAAAPVTPGMLPEELRRKFVGRDGRYLLEIYPGINTWERAGARRFVDELRTVAPDVTGTPVVGYESIVLMERAYRSGTLYAFVLVTVLTVAILGASRYTALGLVPFTLGTLWAVGLMPALGLTFNLSNVWGLPLIIGASAEYGLNIVTRFMESRQHGGPAFARSTGSAVLLNGLTTMVGFGSLLVAHHRGIWSLGLLLTLGSCTGLVASLLVLPALLRLFGTPRVPAGQRLTLAAGDVASDVASD